MFEVDLSNVAEYLRSHGLVPAEATVWVEALGGGVSNRVVRVDWDGSCVVLKQPLENLAVEEDWPADRSRVHNEAAAARAYGATRDDTDHRVRVPGVELEDRDNHIIAIECAPADAASWKAELLGGLVDLDVARAVGEFLAAVHRTAATDGELRAEFQSKRPFRQLRIDPYHRTVAERHPDIATAVLAEVDRVLSVDRTLVHGDYSPKNVLVDRAGDGGVWLLDFEVAHWGDPAFDVGFMLNHLFIKSVYHMAGTGDLGSECVDAAVAFWHAYRSRIPWDIEAESVTELAILMLARVDGKSPVEYVDEGPVADTLRTIGRRALLDDVRTLTEYRTLVREERDRL